MSTKDLALRAKAASIPLAASTLDQRNSGLLAIADSLTAKFDQIVAANRLDLQAAAEANLPTPMQKRLVLDEAKLGGVIEGLRQLATLPDPLGRLMTNTEMAPGLELKRVSCPIGVIGIIFEARPDALVQISSLCLKSGNAALMKGGSEALNTNRALYTIIVEATNAVGLPADWLQLLETRTDVNEMLQCNDCIDLIVPRGSNAFVRYIQQNTTIPVLGHSDGICHTYIHGDAELQMAVSVVVDAKTQYVSACNTTETLLVHADAAAMLPEICAALRAKKVELRGCERSRQVVPDLIPATEEDWDTEYLDYILSIKIVDTLEEAIGHINRHGSRHTEAIITKDAAAAETFLRLVDAADVFWNASTRFADGFRFGLGAEVGISTSKIHSRGPVGLEGLTIYKWQIRGNGHTVAPFASGEQSFTHRQL